MSLEELLQAKREDILRIAKNYGAYNVRVFGSVTRGEVDAKSDIDLLIDMEKGRSLFNLGGTLDRPARYAWLRCRCCDRARFA